ncbi:MAG: YecA family protein [Pseudomonadota bacterium]|nr:YecA family protein [Pseudomonadota bacterium]
MPAQQDSPAGAAVPVLNDADLQRLQALLDALPLPLQPLDVSALDGYLCGVLLQPQRPPPSRWLAHVVDVDGQPAPAGVDLQPLHALVLRRFAELDHAIAERQWFDPWIYALDGDPVTVDPFAEPAAGPETGAEIDAAFPSLSDSVLPWTAGFAAAMEHFPAVMDSPDPELVEPLALLFMHFDPDDLEDADALLAVIETLEPPSDLAEAVQDTVRALMLIADVTRPRQAAARSARRHAPPTPHGPRSQRPKPPPRRLSR